MWIRQHTTEKPIGQKEIKTTKLIDTKNSVGCWGALEGGEMHEEGQEVQTSICEMNGSWGSGTPHCDCSQWCCSAYLKVAKRM